MSANLNSGQRRKLMARLFVMQDGLCAFCRHSVPHPEDRERYRPSSHTAPSIDHVIPSSRGGSSSIRNLLLAHRKCNSQRGVGPLSKAARQTHKANLRILDAQRTAAAEDAVAHA